MGDTVQNDTYGELSRAELAEMRANAETCLTCGMLATVDPVFHQARYGHAPVIAGESGRLAWQAASLSWVPEFSAVPVNCWGCGKATLKRRHDGVWCDVITGRPHTCGVVPTVRACRCNGCRYCEPCCCTTVRA